MFTVEQIKTALVKVKSGADFPDYIREIKQLGVASYVTWVADGHTEYFGENGFRATSEPRYASLKIADQSQKEVFEKCIKIHQQGGSDYPTVSRQAAETGVEKWAVNLVAMTCTYFDRAGNEILVEQIPE